MREMEIPLLMTKAVWSTEPLVRQEEMSKQYMAMQHFQTWGVKSQICWMIVDNKPCWALIALLSPSCIQQWFAESLCSSADHYHNSQRNQTFDGYYPK